MLGDYGFREWIVVVLSSLNLLVWMFVAVFPFKQIMHANGSSRTVRMIQVVSVISLLQACVFMEAALFLPDIYHWYQMLSASVIRVLDSAIGIVLFAWVDNITNHGGTPIWAALRKKFLHR